LRQADKYLRGLTAGPATQELGNATTAHHVLQRVMRHGPGPGGDVTAGGARPSLKTAPRGAAGGGKKKNTAHPPTRPPVPAGGAVGGGWGGIAGTAQRNPHPAGTSKPAAATTAPAFPAFVHLPDDQAAQPRAADEWWYVVGHLNAHGHRFGYEVQIGNVQVP